MSQFDERRGPGPEPDEWWLMPLLIAIPLAVVGLLGAFAWVSHNAVHIAVEWSGLAVDEKHVYLVCFFSVWFGYVFIAWWRAPKD